MIVVPIAPGAALCSNDDITVYMHLKLSLNIQSLKFELYFLSNEVEYCFKFFMDCKVIVVVCKKCSNAWLYYVLNKMRLLRLIVKGRKLRHRGCNIHGRRME